MSVSKAVHFRSKDSIIEGYLNRKVPAFAVFQQGQFIFKYEGQSLEEGEQLLDSWIDMLDNDRSAAIYTVCVYEDLKEGTKIKSNTPYDGSFNFRLYDQAAGYLPPDRYNVYQSQGGNVKALLDKFEAQQQEIERLREELEERDKEPENKLGMIGEILKHEQFGPIAVGLIERLTNTVLDNVLGKEGTTGNQERPPIRKISGIAVDERTLTAVARLGELVEDVPGLLEQLIKLAESKPKQFEFYRSMLSSMKL